jgi:hypothetical protein
MPEDQLIAALDHRYEALRVARDRSGETAADERLEQLMDEKYAAYTRVANTNAVRAFQQVNGLPVSGGLDAATWGTLKRDGAPVLKAYTITLADGVVAP